jgi:hypothetical protein
MKKVIPDFSAPSVLLAPALFFSDVSLSSDGSTGSCQMPFVGQCALAFVEGVAG